MKTTQDLVMLTRELGELRKQEIIIVVYPDKSFDIQEYTAESNTLESIYCSDSFSDGLDINDLCYYGAEFIQERINEATLAEELVKTFDNLQQEVSNTNPLNRDKYSEI